MTAGSLSDMPTTTKPLVRWTLRLRFQRENNGEIKKTFGRSSQFFKTTPLHADVSQVFS